ncbi:hypothetical protein GGP84_003175 [Salinibacter ruber]|uniref:sulfotransferase domain-containing protein n=1 Tax=Salinibacter ruber TaxID=146919 RepID=UPI0021676C49|nr:hypothetical protein [Salinibacter ruber]
MRLFQPETRLWGREEGTLPAFLVIGAQRSGSTFLHDYLSLNTSAQCSPLQKELHYFDNKFYKPLQWYATFFEPLDGAGPAVKNFETSPGYLYHPAVPQRIKECLPEVKAVAVLRNPVERAISQYKWIRKCDLETRGPVEAFRADAEQIEREQDESYLTQFEDPLHFDFEHFHHGYLRRSLYHVQLRRWLRHFPSSQLRVLTSTALFEQTQNVMDQLAAYLEIEHVGEAQLASINQNSSPDDIEIPAEARDIAEQHLADVESKVRSVITPDMVVGDTFTLE